MARELHLQQTIDHWSRFSKFWSRFRSSSTAGRMESQSRNFSRRGGGDAVYLHDPKRHTVEICLNAPSVHFSGPAASGSSRFGPNKTSFSCFSFGRKHLWKWWISTGNWWILGVPPHWGHPRQQRQRCSPQAVREGAQRGYGRPVSFMFRDGNLDFEAYGYHMDNIWIYGYWMILSEISASFAP